MTAYATKLGVEGLSLFEAWFEGPLGKGLRTHDLQVDLVIGKTFLVQDQFAQEVGSKKGLVVKR